MIKHIFTCQTKSTNTWLNVAKDLMANCGSSDLDLLTFVRRHNGSGFGLNELFETNFVKRIFRYLQKPSKKPSNLELIPKITIAKNHNSVILGCLVSSTMNHDQLDTSTRSSSWWKHCLRILDGIFDKQTNFEAGERTVESSRRYPTRPQLDR